jgi:hypothetical protein
MKQEKKMRVTMRFRNPSIELYERVMGCVLTMKEATTVRYLMGGFAFETNKCPLLMLRELEAEGFHTDDYEALEFQFPG